MNILLPLLLATASLVAGHGYIETAVIDGTKHTFWQINSDPYIQPPPQRVARPVQGNGPVEDVDILDIQCGGFSAGGIVGSSPAALHANATAGSNVTLNWTLWPTSHFGATATYMARCPETGCQAFLPNTTAVWFKVQEEGMTAFNGGGDKDIWSSTPLMKQPNAGATYQIPPCLADGFYLVRHEIISVFVASSYPGAQFYPGCHQLKVTGGGSTTVKDLVAFPGAYKGSDPGITWKNGDPTYIVPGPKLFTCS